MAVQTKIQVRRDTAAIWANTNPILSSGEFGFETDTGALKIGNGSTAWTSLAYVPALGANSITSTMIVDGTIANTDISPTAAIAFSKLASSNSAQLASIISDETGTGSLVFGTSPTIATSIVTANTSFDLINTNATTVNFAGVGTAVAIGATTGKTTINNGLVLKQTLEPVTIDSATNLSATATQIDTLTSSIYHFTGTPSADFTLNIRGNATITDLNTIMSVGQSLTVTIIVDRILNVRKLSVIQINGVSQTVNWFGGAAPATGNSLDIYSITIIKNGASTYRVFLSQSKFG